MSKAREYRGMRTDNGEWVYGYVVKSKFSDKEAYLIEHDAPFHSTCYEVIPQTVGQAIGKTDINGKKVFDGDIVKLHLEDGVEIGHIAFDEKSYRYVFVEEGGTPYGIDDTVKLEVLGTVYENPELLGGKQ